MFERCDAARSATAMFGVAIVALTGCGGEVDEPSATCGTAEFAQLPAALAPLDALAEPDRNVIVDALIAAGDFEGRDWQVVSDGEQLVLFGTPTDSNFPYGHATFDRGGDGLQLETAGNCNLSFDTPGMSIASFRLDPEKPIDPAESSIPILFTERACASGGAVNGREVQPSVIESAERIEIIVLIEANDGPQDCQGNSEVGWVVELDAPVGQRSIADASAIPARDLRG